MRRDRSSFHNTLSLIRVVIQPYELPSSLSAVLLSDEALGVFVRMLPYVSTMVLPDDLTIAARYAHISTRRMKRIWPEFVKVGLFTRSEHGWEFAPQPWIAIQRVSVDRENLRGFLAKLVEFWGEACVYCGRVSDLEIEHIVPLARGGTNELDNLTLACRDCNSKKRTQTAAEFGHPHIQEQARRIQ